MSTNQMRREAAKRKLERQQQRRAMQAARRRKVTVITAAAVAVLVVVGIVALTVARSGAGAPAQPVAAACSFTPSGQPAKPVTAPDVTDPEKTGTVAVTLTTNHGTIPLSLDRAKAPCTVESFVHLTKGGFFNGTPCHRLTTGRGLQVLQCGDPTGTGKGGPGYTIPDEPPVGLAPAPAPTPGGSEAVIYPRGTIAMAKTDQPNSGGSQFFLVYADSTLPPDYTVFGTIGEPGLAVLDKIAAAGENSENGPGDGAPNQPVTIESAAVS